MNCIGINYKKADVNVRRRISLSSEKAKELIRYIIDNGIAAECVALSTCNRTEVYYSDGDSEKIVSALGKITELENSFLIKYAMTFCGEKAEEHLFRVASGLDSMVVGEDEILGQTKAAYSLAAEENAVGYETNVIFQAAVACAKRIKTETAMSKTSVSVATLAAKEAARLSDNVSVVMIGASGRIGMSTLKNLISHRNVTVTATLRHGKAAAKELGSLGVKAIDYSDRYEHIKQADCVISATSSPHYTVTRFDFEKCIDDHRQRLFIDLAVPPDIDPAIRNIPGAKLINIDEFETLAKENNDLKLSCIDDAEQIIAQELDTLRKDMRFHEFLPYFEKAAKETVALEKLVYKMKSQATAAAFSEFLSVLQGG